MVLKRRTKRKMLGIGLVLTIVFLVVIASASARGWTAVWSTYPPLSWFF